MRAAIADHMLAGSGPHVLDARGGDLQVFEGGRGAEMALQRVDVLLEDRHVHLALQPSLHASHDLLHAVVKQRPQKIVPLTVL